MSGVPWTTFFTESGIAFHGTYWRDNFGTPMSRGCINMRIDEAKWLFRWARPLHEFDRIFTPGYRTRVVITPWPVNPYIFKAAPEFISMTFVIAILADALLQYPAL